jgi:hypothetical protein
MALGLGFVAGFLTQWVGRLWHDPK